MEREVLDTYAGLDLATTELSNASGLACPPRCGRCCAHPEVSASVVEMLPMALEMQRRGELEVWRRTLAERAHDARCAVYRPDPGEEGLGRCGLYAWRPIVCRAFGFMARRDKHGHPELSACPVHRESAPEALERARDLVAAGFPAPNAADTARRVALLSPQEAVLLPINQALARALESVALHAHFAAAERDAPEPEGSGAPPLLSA